MVEIKLTKNGLRSQQIHLTQLEKYLPTLQLKKAMLQAEVQEVRIEIQRIEAEVEEKKREVEIFSPLLATKTTVNPLDAIQVKEIHKQYENIAGVEVPHFKGVDFVDFSYNLFETSPWIDGAIIHLRALKTWQEHLIVVCEQKQALEKEWKEVSTRVNLFEKMLIPRAVENIRIIKVFLNDQQLAAVSRAKVAKTKIEAKKATTTRRASCVKM